MPKIVIAIDSFKGCLTSQEAGQAAAQGVRTACPECEMLVLPVTDGGEGMLEAMLHARGGNMRYLKAHDPLMNFRDTCYGISHDGSTAFIEMARISGLPLVPQDKRNPMLTTTFGTGELVRDALRCGCRRILIGLGGSATNDAGMGMLQALGFRFLDNKGRDAGIGGQALAHVTSINTSAVMPELYDSNLIAACDVSAPFFGPQGAASVFAPQKGANSEMVAALDSGLRHFAKILRQYTKHDISRLPRAGAAGGMGGSLYASLNVELTSGIELTLKAADFAKKIHDADLVITGEGKADRQTLMGKVPAGILTESRAADIPVALLAGQVEDERALSLAGFRYVLPINHPCTPLATAIQPDYARQRLTATVEKLIKAHIQQARR